MVEEVWGVDTGLAGLGKDGPLSSLGIVWSWEEWSLQGQ